LKKNKLIVIGIENENQVTWTEFSIEMLYEQHNYLSILLMQIRDKERLIIWLYLTLRNLPPSDWYSKYWWKRDDVWASRHNGRSSNNKSNKRSKIYYLFPGHQTLIVNQWQKREYRNY
jgi:hypothetical protein